MSDNKCKGCPSQGSCCLAVSNHARGLSAVSPVSAVWGGPTGGLCALQIHAKNCLGETVVGRDGLSQIRDT